MLKKMADEEEEEDKALAEKEHERRAEQKSRDMETARMQAEDKASHCYRETFRIRKEWEKSENAWKRARTSSVGDYLAELYGR